MITVVHCLCALLLAPLVTPAPTSNNSSTASILSSSISNESSSLPSLSTETASAAEATETVPFASDDPNPILWLPDNHTLHEPIRDGTGATVMGPTNKAIVDQNADLFAPPTTDVGTIANAKWPFSLSHNQLQAGGWARQQNVDEMPIATAMAGVNMRLEPGAIRELHWHTSAEWAYVIKGSTQITSVNQNGQNYIATVKAGDLWYFPPGIPHSLQGTADDPEGTEFLLVFPDGTFNDDSTFQLTDWLAHVPKEVLANNFQTDISAFDHIPGRGLYMFPSAAPPDDQQDPVSPQGTVPQPYSFSLSTFNATAVQGGSVKIVDSTVFAISTQIAMAEITVEPGAIRELHWHPTQDEWAYYLEGEGRLTMFASGANSRSYNFQAGDIGYVPAAYGHYVQNIGNTTLKFLEIFNTDRFEDVSLSQWLALTPPDIVKAHLQVSDETISHFSKTKPIVVGPVSA